MKVMTQPSHISLFNVRDFGASGRKDDDARTAIQAAIDACAAVGGGMVYFPPGEYTSGTLHLRSHVRVHLKLVQRCIPARTRNAFDKHGLFYAEGVENITLEGRGTVHGQATYEWRLHDIKDWYIYPNQVLAEQGGRAFDALLPHAGFVWQPGAVRALHRCAHHATCRFSHSPSWTMHLCGCERLVIDGVYVCSSLKYGVWADGIDPDGCKDVCNLQLHHRDRRRRAGVLLIGSSAMARRGRARTSRSPTAACPRPPARSSFAMATRTPSAMWSIDNCVITDSNRGIAFMVFDGGVLENIVMTNLTIECRPFDWFWWGDGDPIAL